MVWKKLASNEVTPHKSIYTFCELLQVILSNRNENETIKFLYIYQQEIINNNKLPIGFLNCHKNQNFVMAVVSD
jgi:hypothetical protein